MRRQILSQMGTAPLYPGGGPLYRQIKERLVQEISQGRYPVTDPLPSEHRLAARFGVSQGTVRRALDELARESLVIRQQGRGTFVHAHGSERGRFHFFNLVAPDGERRLPASRVLSLTLRQAKADESFKLRLTTTEEVIELRRVRELRGQPAILETIVLPHILFPELASASKTQIPNTLYQLYQERFGVIIHRAVEQITAVAAGPEDVKHLGLDRGAPLLHIERVAQMLDGTAVELRISRCDTRHQSYLSDLV